MKVLIGQWDTLQEHIHSLKFETPVAASGTSFGTYYAGNYQVAESGQTEKVKNARTSSETKSKNISLKTWLRTS